MLHLGTKMKMPMSNDSSLVVIGEEFHGTEPSSDPNSSNNTIITNLNDEILRLNQQPDQLFPAGPTPSEPPSRRPAGASSTAKQVQETRESRALYEQYLLEKLHKGKKDKTKLTQIMQIAERSRKAHPKSTNTSVDEPDPSRNGISARTARKYSLQQREATSGNGTAKGAQGVPHIDMQKICLDEGEGKTGRSTIRESMSIRNQMKSLLSELFTSNERYRTQLKAKIGDTLSLGALEGEAASGDLEHFFEQLRIEIIALREAKEKTE